jgi:hypothetical protein
MKRAAVLITMTIGLLLASSTARAQEVAAPNAATPPRLSLVEGQVSFLRPGAQDWAPARMKAVAPPLAKSTSAGSAGVRP